MGVTVCPGWNIGKLFSDASQKRLGWAEMVPQFGRPPVGVATRPRTSALPRNHCLPAIYRLLDEAAVEPLAQGELARDPRLALAEAALFAADEPLLPRRLA